MARNYEKYVEGEPTVGEITLTIDNKSSHKISFTSQSLNTNIGMGGTVSQGTYFSSIEPHSSQTYKSSQWAAEGLGHVTLLDLKNESCIVKLNAADQQKSETDIVNYNLDYSAYPCPWLKFSIQAKPVKMFYKPSNTFLYYDYDIIITDK